MIAAGLTVMTAAGPVFASEPDLEIIIDRRGESVEVFVSLDATDIPHVFNNSTEFIAKPDEAVEYEALLEGTWDQGDALIQGTSFQVNGQLAALEGKRGVDPTFR